MPDKSKSSAKSSAPTGPIPTTVFPIKDRWTHDNPAAVHVVATKAAADELVASGAFTTDPDDPQRDHAAPDLTGESPEPAPVETPAADEPKAEATDLANSQPDADAGIPESGPDAA